MKRREIGSSGARSKSQQELEGVDGVKTWLQSGNWTSARAGVGLLFYPKYLHIGAPQLGARSAWQGLGLDSLMIHLINKRDGFELGSSWFCKLT